jgi:hypothetical protein
MKRKGQAASRGRQYVPDDDASNMKRREILPGRRLSAGGASGGGAWYGVEGHVEKLLL